MVLVGIKRANPRVTKHNTNMKTQTENKAPLATTVQTADVKVDRKPDTIASLLTFHADGSATFTKGANLNAYELGEYAGQQANDSQSAALRAVSALRIARDLPDVDAPKASGEGTYKRKAFDVACDRCASVCRTTSAWSNVKGLIEAVDVAIANQLEPYKVKNSLGYLKKLNLLDDKLKLKDGAKADVGVKAVLDKTVKSNAVVKKLQEAKASHNAEAKAAGKEVPFPSLESKKPTPAATGNGGTNHAQTDATPESVARMLTAARGIWDKLVGIDATNVAKLRTACKAEIEAIAKLGGYKLVSL